MFGVAAVASVSGSAMATFGLSFAALIAFWVLSGGLVLARRAHEVGFATLAGVAAGFACYYAAGDGMPRLSSRIALTVGYVTTMVSLAARVTVLVAYRRSDREAPRLPRPPYLLREALPFTAYGGLLLLLVLGPNLATALRASSGASRSGAQPPSV